MPAASSPPRAKKSFLRRLRVRLAYLLLVVIMAFFAYSFWEKSQEVKQLTAQEVALQQENAQTRADNQRVRALIAWYKTPQYVEETARADLGYTMPGEVPVQARPIVQRAPVIRAAPPTPVPTPAPTWQQWWDVFSH